MIHLLSEISIRNFKSIKNETFDFSEFTPLIGYNNAGKSNMLEAIKWLLRKNSLGDSSFNDTAQAVEMEGKISGISSAILAQLPENQRTSILPFLFTDSLFIKRVQPLPNASVANIKLLVKDPANIGTANEWKLNPTGLDQAIQALFPEPIHIGAMENSEEDVSKSKNTSTIGKLLAEIIGPIQTSYSTQVQTALDGIKNLLDIDGTTRATELNEFDTTVSGKVESFFPGVRIKVHVPTPELKEVFSKGTIKVAVELENTGTRDGKEVVQLYVRDKVSSVATPVQQLKAFKKEPVKAGKRIKIMLEVPVSELGLYNDKMQYVVETGEFDIQVGSAADNIYFHKTITVK